MSLSQNPDILSTIMSVAYFVFFFVYMFFSQRIQTVLMMRQISKALTKLGNMRDKAKQAVILEVTKAGRPEKDPKPGLEALL